MILILNPSNDDLSDLRSHFSGEVVQPPVVYAPRMYSFTAEILRTTVQRRTGCDILLAVGVDTGSTETLSVYIYIQRHIRTQCIYSSLFCSILFYDILLYSILYFILFYFTMLYLYYVLFYCIL